MIARAVRTALASPSTANGTPASEGWDPRTKVINGCTEATAAPRLRRTSSTSLVKAPLECNATLPFQSTAFASNRAASRISPSGTQNQTTWEPISAGETTLDFTSRASARACRTEAAPERVTIPSIVYPARNKAVASAPARLPAPTIVIPTLAAMTGSIADPDASFPLPHTAKLWA